MNVKGSAYLARKMLLEKEFGEAEAARMIADVLRSVPSMPQPILASTVIPINAFLAFQDELLRRHYQGDARAYFRFGEKSAEWALTAGPYKRLTNDRDVAAFATQGAALFRTYFDAGAATTSLENGHIAFRIDDVPAPFRHVYIEYATIGFFKRGLEIFGATNVVAKRVRGFSLGHANVSYELSFKT